MVWKMTRCEMLGIYIVQNSTTIRQTAEKFGISKSLVHNDLHKKLPYVNPNLYVFVQRILDENFSVRHIRGGLATKQKYLNKKGYI